VCLERVCGSRYRDVDSIGWVIGEIICFGAMGSVLGGKCGEEGGESGRRINRRF